MRSTLRDRIDDGRVHVLDGAMGTVLYAKGMFVNVCYDQLNLTEPDLVRAVHLEYLRAGAEILETNTFGANPVKLSAHRLERDTEAINRAAASIAREVAGDTASVLGSVGPLGIRIEPFGPTSRDEARAFFARQIAGLVDGGVDGIVLETFSDLDEIHAAYLAARDASDLPVFALMTVGESGHTTYGTDVERIAEALTAWGADVIGLNCSVGPAMMLEAVERMAAVSDRPLAALPNAGLPRVVADRKIYLSSPDYMAKYAQRLIQAGARFVGGCCGTTADHVREIRDLVATMQPPHHPPVAARAEPGAAGGAAPVPLAARSNWGRRIAQGDWVVNVELVPPPGWRPDTLLDQARALGAIGVDVVSVPDGPRAHSRMGAVPTAMLIERETGVETVVHYTCRDRNMLGMISDLLGAAAGGLRNLLLVTGDPPRFGPYADATGVFDIDSIGLTNLVRRLNHGQDPGGNPIGDPTPFVIGVALNHAAVDPERELRRLYWKVDAGAEVAVTQPVFDVEQFERFVRKVGEFRIPVIAGIWPLASLANAEFLAYEVPGQRVPAAVLNRMRAAHERGPDAASAEGVAIAREVLAAVRPMVAGVHLSLPFGRVDRARAVLEP